MVKGRGPLFGIEIDGERKNFLNRADAEQIQAAVVAQGGKAVIFEHSEAEIISREAPAAEGLFFDLGDALLYRRPLVGGAGGLVNAHFAATSTTTRLRCF